MNNPLMQTSPKILGKFYPLQRIADNKEI